MGTRRSERNGRSCFRGLRQSKELVPRGYLPKPELSQELLGHLRWMLQKDLLKQDMFLIGCVARRCSRERDATH